MKNQMRDFKIKIVQESEAKKVLSDKEFLNQWKKLANDDEKCTVIQEPHFVITWYKQYYSRFIPVLILAFDAENKLIGLLPIAREISSNLIFHAGAWQAEYRGWIARSDINEKFIVESIKLIKNSFKPKTWQWGWLPPNSPIDCFNTLIFKEHNIYVRSIVRKSPVWDLNDNKRLKKLTKNKSIKWSINSYKKRGGLYIERIKSKNRARELLKELKNQYDFRQMVANGICPFMNDQFKESFFVEKLNFPDLFHFTVLWCEKKPIAFNHGSCDNDTIYLGVTGFDPLETKYSPGKLLLIYLAEMASAEGYRYIDLTPGGELYKKRFSNSEQTLYNIVIYFNKIEKIKAEIYLKLQEIIKSILMLTGKKDEIVKYCKRIDINYHKERIKRFVFKKAIKKVFSLFYENRVYLYYRLKKEDIVLRNNKSIKVRKQKYADLLKYSGSNPWISKKELLSRSLDRFVSGETLYSIIVNGSLAHWGWLTKGGKKHFFTEVDMTFNSPKNCYILYDFYTEPKCRRQKLYQINMLEMIHDSFRNGAEQVFIGVNSKNLPSKKAIEKVGFKLYRSYIKKRILFICSKRSF